MYFCVYRGGALVGTAPDVDDCVQRLGEGGRGLEGLGVAGLLPAPRRMPSTAAEGDPSFDDGADTRRLMIDRYRRLMAQQCACNAIEPN